MSNTRISPHLSSLANFTTADSNKTNDLFVDINAVDIDIVDNSFIDKQEAVNVELTEVEVVALAGIESAWLEAE